MWKLLLTVYASLQKLDAHVSADAADQGITKDEAWAGARAAAVIQTHDTVEWLLELADPLGWRAAARALA